MRSQGTFPCVGGRVPGTHTHRTQRRRRRGPWSWLPEGWAIHTAWLSVQHHAQSHPSRKKGQTYNTQTGLLPQARALSRVSHTHTLTVLHVSLCNTIQTSTATMSVCMRSRSGFSCTTTSPDRPTRCHCVGQEQPARAHRAERCKVVTGLTLLPLSPTLSHSLPLSPTLSHSLCLSLSITLSSDTHAQCTAQARVERESLPKFVALARPSHSATLVRDKFLRRVRTVWPPLRYEGQACDYVHVFSHEAGGPLAGAESIADEPSVLWYFGLFRRECAVPSYLLWSLLRTIGIKAFELE